MAFGVIIDVIANVLLNLGMFSSVYMDKLDLTGICLAIGGFTTFIPGFVYACKQIQLWMQSDDAADS